jgi:hypothetical protein
VVAVALSTACGQRATIHTRDGYTHVGTIERGDPRHVVFDDGKGRIVAVPRSAVEEVDHPGTPAIIAGSVVIAVGALWGLALANADCYPDDRLTCGEQESTNEAAGWVLFGLHAIPGTGVLLYGIVIKTLSVDRHEATDGRRISLPTGLSVEGHF